MRRNIGGCSRCSSLDIKNVIFNWAWEEAEVERFVKANYKAIAPIEYIFFRDGDVGEVFNKKHPELLERFISVINSNTSMNKMLSYSKLSITHMHFDRNLDLEVGRVIKAAGFFTKKVKEQILENRKKYKKVKTVIDS